MATDSNTAGQLVDRKGQEWQERSVVVKQGPDGFGFTISKQYPVFVESVTLGGPADEAGIRQGDRIIRVNGKDAVSLEHEKVVDLIKDSSVVSLTVLAKFAKNTLGVEISPPRQLQDISPQNLKAMLQRHHKMFEALSVEYSRTCSAKVEKELMDCESLIKILETEIALKSHSVEAFIETTQSNVATLTGRKRTPAHRSASFMDERLNKLARRAEEDGERRGKYPISVSPIKGLSKAATTIALSNGTSSPVKKMVSIYPPNCDDLDSDDNDQDFQQDTGDTDPSPFSSLQELKNSPAHMAAFLTYLLNNRDPKYMLFHLVANSYQTVCKATDLRHRGMDISWTFVLADSPLCLNLSEPMAGRIVNTLESEENDNKLRNVFVEARESLNAVIAKDLSSFREKRTLGLGWMFGDKQMSNKMTPKEELESLNAILLPILKQYLYIDDKSDTTSEEILRNQAIAASLATFMYDVYEKHKGDPRALNPQIEGVQGFTRPDKKKSIKKKVAQCGHTFMLMTFRKPTLCEVCKKPLWGVIYHGYQCSVCDYSVHRHCCISDVNDICRKKKASTTTPTQILRKQSLVNVVFPPTDSESRTDAHPLDPPPPPSLPPLLPPPPPVHSAACSQPAEEVQGSSSSPPNDVIGVTIEEPAAAVTTGERPRSVSDPEYMHNQVIQLNEPFSPEGKLRGGRDNNQHVRVSRAQSDRQSKKPESLSFIISTPPSAIGSSTSSFADEPPFSAIPSSSGSLYRPLDTLMEYEGVHDDMRELMESDVGEELIPWALTAKREVVQSLKRYQIERQELIKELVYTERTHLQKLNLMKYMYKIPLQRQSVLTAQQLEQLFPSLEELILFHGGLCADLKERVSVYPDGIVKNVADVLLSRFDGAAGQRLCHACSVFASNQITAERLFKEWKTRNEKFRMFVLKAENNYLSHRLTFNELIPIAWQRLTKYKLLIEGIQKTYKKHNIEELDAFDKEEFEKLGTAISCVQGILHYVNKQVRRAGNRQRLAAYQAKLDTSALERTAHPVAQLYKTLELTAEDRVLLHEGALTLRLHNKKTIELHALLLTDIIVLLERNEDKDKYHLRCHMLESIHGTRVELSPIIKLKDSLLRHSAADRGNRTFFVVNNSPTMKLAQMYEFIAEGPQEKKQWEEAIMNAMRASTGRISPPEHLTSDDLTADMSASNIHTHMDLREQLNKIDEDLKRSLTEKIVILRAKGGVHIPVEPYRQRDTKPPNTPTEIVVSALEQVGKITDTVSKIMVPNPTKSNIAETQTQLKDIISELQKTLSQLAVALGEQPLQHRLPLVSVAIESASEASSTTSKDPYSPLDTFAERNSRALMPEELTELSSNTPLSPMTLNTTDSESPSKDDESNEASTPLFSNRISDHNWQEKNSSAISGEHVPFSYDMHMTTDEDSTNIHVPASTVAPPVAFSGETLVISVPTPHTTEPEEDTPVPSPTQNTFSSPLIVREVQQEAGKQAKSFADGTSAELSTTEPVSPLVGIERVSGLSLKEAQQAGAIFDSEQT